MDGFTAFPESPTPKRAGLKSPKGGAIGLGELRSSNYKWARVMNGSFRLSSCPQGQVP